MRFQTRHSHVIQADGGNLTRTTCEVHHDYFGQNFHCSCGCRHPWFRSLRDCAACAGSSQPPPSSPPQTRRRRYRTGRPRLRLLRGLRLLLETSARRGQLGLACASRTSLRLKITNSDYQKLNGLCVSRCEGRFPVAARAHFTAAKSPPLAPAAPTIAKI